MRMSFGVLSCPDVVDVPSCSLGEVIVAHREADARTTPKTSLSMLLMILSFLNVPRVALHAIVSMSLL